MHPQKRPLDLVELARRVADLDRVRFLVVGGGDLEAAVDRAIAASGARVRRLPFRDDIPDLIAASDAGCLVSDFEGLPVFLLSACRPALPRHRRRRHGRAAALDRRRHRRRHAGRPRALRPRSAG
jgi:glycosyltransferase involved in cell wall biosynthesis